MRFEFDDVRVRYPGAPGPALTGVTAEVPSASFYAVLGPNGSGKSTLVRALLGSIPMLSGHTRIDGRDTRDWSRRELARAVGVVPQAEALSFPLRVRELVEMGRYPHLGLLEAPRGDDRDAVEAALVSCDVAHLAGRNVQTLSGGELQRVRIARALAQQPAALVLDEPTASLDIRHEMAILELLRRLADEGHTVLLITHHLDLAARYADRVLLLDCGHVVAEGTPRQVFRPETLESVYRWPVQVTDDPVTGTPRVTPLPDPGPRPEPPRL